MKFRFLVFPLASIAFLLLITACASRQTASSAPDEVIWEAWEAIKDSYVEANSLDAELVVGGVVNGMLDFAEKPSYPFLTELGQMTTPAPRKVPKELTNIWRAWTLFGEKWPGVDSNLLSEAALRSMMDSLEDPVSTYLSAEAYERTQRGDEGSYEGIGAVIGIQDGQVTIVSPMSDSPAERAGLRQGDVILQINGKPPVGDTLEEAVAEIKGEAGSRVTFLIQRPTEVEPREISLTRATIDVPTVDMSFLPGSVGYLYIEKFQDNTLDEVLDHLELFNRLETLAVILDLRSTVGGSLEVARSVASQFLADGLFLYQVDNKEARTDLIVEEGGIATEEGLLVVLVNGGTAEAAEALAGALQDSGRAVLLGDRTQGKGSTNDYHKLSNGGALFMPTSYWYTPSGRAIAEEGIQPDIEASLSQQDLLAGTDSQLQTAYDYLDDRLPSFR